MGCLLFVALIILIINPAVFFALCILTIVVTACFAWVTIKDDDKIVSAEVIERIQVTKDEYQRSGFSFGWHGGARMYWRVKQVPSHIEVIVEVAYNDGKRRVVSLREGSLRYHQIMAIAARRSGNTNP